MVIDIEAPNSNPQKRAVYDLLGEEGLKTEWEVGQKLKSPEEVSWSNIDTEYDRLTIWVSFEPNTKKLAYSGHKRTSRI